MSEPKDVIYGLCRDYVLDTTTDELTANEKDLILGWIRSRSLDLLASCTDYLPDALSSGGRYRTLKQIESFFKKNSLFAGPEGETAALDTFRRAEKICRITNRRLEHYYVKRHRMDDDLNLQCLKAERTVASVLGDLRSFLDVLPSMLRVTAGATSSTPRSKSQPQRKISLSPWATPGASRYLTVLAGYFGYNKFKPRLALTNRVEVVPKNWKTGRTIACEPAGNLPLQLALDEYLKIALKRKLSINLSLQSRNQELARIGSLDGSLATIDLSMASDLLSMNTVAWLFPRDWYEYLKDTRSPCGRLSSGEIIRYAKLSSMGNGYTFTLETLVFASLAKAVGSKRFSVYGDDIIIETELVGPLLRLLRFFGFQINRDKSFTEGPFRESCGANWYEGIDITPFRITEWNVVKSTLSHNVNGLASVAKPGGKLENSLLRIIRDNKLLLVPFNEDSRSGVFIDVHSAYQLKLIRTHCQMGRKGCPYTLFFRSYRPKAKSLRFYRSSALFLWYLDKYRRNEYVAYSFVSRSRATAASTKYVRKWVHWSVPVVVTPVHLYRWTELILHFTVES